ncbi:MAG TPA: UDP-N-acetylmuramoyl-tripeptide--D-alanyl-D-alanine ligase [Bacteroidia bacterium]|jgi:UDP-N-acetylmuramoyl-tripeptide--D-alanyl-D-alanine ligase|nr:UDP-N-acetylmuramoyl-tripeptide--D-alanyl-D-alanine ligase [Bacteroidia bacterium]
MEIKKLHEIFLASGKAVCTDTRKTEEGSIFFALKGDNFNGNQFAAKALECGCAYAVVDEKNVVVGDKYILVEDVLKALQQLANYHRKQFDIPVIAITGSNGKTTTKELLHAVLSKKFKVQYTQGNLNNHIGVPLTLLSIGKEHEMAVIEMGANHQGEIDTLCKIAEPGFGVITNIGKAHLEGFGGIEGVKKGKSELYRYIKEKNGIVFVHGDDEVLNELSAANNKVTYGTKKLYDVIGKYSESNLFVELAWRTRYTAPELKDAPFVRSNIVGVYNYYNALCAACIGLHFKVEDNLIQEAIEEYVPTNNRSQLHKTANNVLILDYYNANPSSMSLAIENFSEMQFQNKMLVLGDMLELGDEAFKEHALILQLLRERKLEDYILVGPIFSALQKEKSFPDSTQAAAFIKSHAAKNKTILVKGSRGIALEKVVEVL